MDSTEVILEYRYRELRALWLRHEDFIRTTIDEAVGTSAYALEPVKHGVTNAVDKVMLRSGESCYVRMHVGARSAFENEKAALALLRDGGVSVPEVMAHQTNPTSDGRVSVIVETTVPGEPLLQLIRAGSIERADIDAIVAQAADVLRKIHAVDASSLAEQPLPTFDVAALTEFNPDDGVKGLSDRDQQAVAQAFDLVANEQRAYALVHGDYDPKHIMVELRSGQWRVSGVIDWEEAHPGDPLFDYGRWAFWNIEPSLTEARAEVMAESYGTDLPSRLQDARRRAAAGAIRWEMDHLGGVTRPTLDLVRLTATSI